MTTPRKYLNEGAEWAWLDTIQVGDVLVAPSGDKRAVRKVLYHDADDRFGRGGKMRSITLAIRNCSWTEKGYTTLDRSSVKTRGFKPTGERFDVLTNVESLTCCEAKMLL